MTPLLTIPDGVFTRAELLESAMRTGAIRETQFRYLLGSLMESGSIVRVGHGCYTKGNAAMLTWAQPYSEVAQSALDALSEGMPLLDFRVWELSWLNEFLNHLVVRNAVVVTVEADGREFAFDALAEIMPGRVLLSPSPDEFTRYGSDGIVVVMRLVSEAPGVADEPHRASIEQVIVDMFCDRLLRSALLTGDYPEAMRSMFSHYHVGQPALFRYARRRNRKLELRELLECEAGIEIYHK